MNTNDEKKQELQDKKTYHNKKLTRKKKTNTRFFILLGVIIFVCYLLVISWSIIFAGNDITPVTLLEPVMSDLLGSLPALILLEIVARQILGDSSSDEISSHIASTLMGDFDVLKDVDVERRKLFVKNSISSLTGEEDAEMLSGFLKPYLNGRYNTRKYQHYYIHVHADLIGDVSAWEGIFSPKKYISVEESLKYTKHYGRQIAKPADNHFPQDFTVDFCIRTKDVHDKYNDPLCMFREYLLVSPEDMLKLSQTVVSDEDKLNFLEHFMNFRLIVKDSNQENNETVNVKNVIFDQFGIHVSCHSSHLIDSQDILFRLSFLMPCLIGHVEFVAQYGEPTFCPSITFVYPKKSTMCPYLLMTGSEIIYAGDADEGETAWNMQLQDQWIYPMSGIVFSLDFSEEVMAKLNDDEKSESE